MSRLGRQYFNTPQIFATPYVVVDPQAVGDSTALAVVSASVTASTIYPNTVVYVYGIKDPTYAKRRGPASLVLYGIEPGDVVTDDTKVSGIRFAAATVEAFSDAYSVFESITASATISAFSVDAPLFYFTTPAIRERRFLRRHRLWDRMYLDRGVSILRFGDAYQVVENPGTEDMESADALFIGGRTYLISEDEALRLQAAGYGDWVSDGPVSASDVDFTMLGASVYGGG